MPVSRATAGERLGRRAGDRLGEVEQRGVLDLAEILGAEQLGQAGDLRPAPAASRSAVAGPAEVVVGVGRAPHLDQAHGERSRGVAQAHGGSIPGEIESDVPHRTDEVKRRRGLPCPLIWQAGCG